METGARVYTLLFLVVIYFPPFVDHLEEQQADVRKEVSQTVSSIGIVMVHTYIRNIVGRVCKSIAFSYWEHKYTVCLFGYTCNSKTWPTVLYLHSM